MIRKGWEWPDEGGGGTMGITMCAVPSEKWLFWQTRKKIKLAVLAKKYSSGTSSGKVLTKKRKFSRGKPLFLQNNT